MPLTVGELYVKLELDSTNFSKEIKNAENLLRDVAKNLKPEVNIDVKVREQQSIKDIQSALQGANQSVGLLRTGFNDLGSTIRSALSVSIGNLLTQPLQALLGAFPSVINSAADFENGLSKVSAVAGNLTTDQLEALRQKALQIGADTSLSASQATSAFEALVSNGIAVDAQFGKIADSTVALSEATGSDLKTAANVTTDVIQNFAGAGEHLEDVVNGITGVTVAGKFGINDYKLALANGGVQVAQLGVSLKDFNTVIAATSSAFASGQTAGTAFRTFIQNLTPSTQPAIDAMKELGFITEDGTNIFYDSTGALKSQSEIFGILQSKMGNLSEQQLSTYSQMLFGADGATILTKAIQLGSKGLDEYAASIDKVNAADIAKTRLDNFKGSVEQLKGSLDTASITLGSIFLPKLQVLVQFATSAVNALTNIISAVDGSQEAFNKLSPSLQAVVVAIQTAINYITSAANSISGVFNNAIGDISGFFNELIGSAFGWGDNIGNQFANGIYNSISGVIEAIQSIGEALAYWMAPGSPPRMYPDLDKDGTAVGQVYVDSMALADLSSLKSFGKDIQDVLGSLVDIGQISDKDAITAVIGTKDAFASAIQEMRSIGSVSQESFNKIIASSGIAGGAVRELVTSYFSLQAASETVRKAQEELEGSQNKLTLAQDAYKKATQGIRDELAKLQAQQELDNIDEQIKDQQKLANAIGGDGSVQEKAKKKLLELELKRQLLEKQAEYQPAIDAAEEEVKKKKEAVEIAQEQEKAEKIKYDLVREQIAAQIEQNKLLKEQLELNKPKEDKQGGGSSRIADQVNKDKEAQDRYNFSLLDTDGKLANLRERLKGVKEGSAEYYEILSQIGNLEEKKADDLDKINKKAEKANEDKVKAERDYQYSIADTGGKLAILKDELSKVEKGSVEYYNILGKINQLESQKPARSGSGAGGLSMPEADPNATNPVVEGIRTVTQAFGDAKLAAEEAKERVARFQEGLSAAKQKVEEFLAPFIPVVDFIKNNFAPVFATIATPAIIALGSAITTGLVAALGTLLSPIALVSIAVGLLVVAWQNNFGGIQDFTKIAMENISAVIDNVLTAIQVFWDTHGEEVMKAVDTAFSTVKSIVETVMKIIGALIKKITGDAKDDTQTNFLALSNIANAIFTALSQFIQTILNIILTTFNIILDAINGDWAKFWNDIKELARVIFEGIKQSIINTLAVILSIFGVQTAAIYKVWNDMGTSLKISWDNTVRLVTSAVTTFLDLTVKSFNGFIKTITDAWDKFKTILPDGMRDALTFVLNKVNEMYADMYEAATNIGEAIINGIRDYVEEQFQQIIDTIMDKIREAQDAIGRMLGGNSGSSGGTSGGSSVPTANSVVAAPMMDSIAMPVGNSLMGANAMSSGNIYNYEFNIDARGSTMNEKQFRDIIRTEVNVISEQGNYRGRR